MNNPNLVSTRLRNAARRLTSATHAPLAPRGRASAAIIVDDATGRSRRESYCLTCRAYDVSGNHHAAGHRTCR